MFKQVLSLTLAVALLFAPMVGIAQTPATVPPAGFLHNADTTNGNGSSLNLGGVAPVTTIQASGTFNSATYTIQISQDNTNWNTATCYTVDGITSFNAAGWLTAAGMWNCNTKGVQFIRAANNSGTPTTLTITAGGSFIGEAAKPSTPGTLTSPAILTGINDSNGNTIIGLTATTSAVNNITITDNIANQNPVLGTAGTDAAVGLSITPKASGTLVVSQSGVNQGAHFEFHATSSPTVTNAMLTSKSTDVVGSWLATNANPIFTFTEPWTNTPICQVWNQLQLTWAQPASAVQISAINVNSFSLASAGVLGGWVSGNTIGYYCVGVR